MKTNSRRYRRHRNPELTDKKDGAFFRPTEKAVQKKDDAFFQPKLTMGQPGDSYEREADSVADKVVSGKSADSTAVQRKEISEVQAKPDKKEEEKKVQKKGAADKKEEEKPVQKKDDKGPKEDEKKKAAPEKKEEEKPVQKKEDAGAKEEEGPADVQAKEEEEPAVQAKEEPEKKPAADEVIKEEKDEKGKGSPSVMAKAGNDKLQDGGDQLAQQLREQRNNGKPLSADVRQEMGNAIGADFDNVRIHTDDKARAMSEDIGAQAFTHGNDVYFNSGRFDTESTQGKRLLAHELTHVVQQGAAPAKEGGKGASTASHSTPGVQREISTPLPKGVEVDGLADMASFPMSNFRVVIKGDRKAGEDDHVNPDKARTDVDIVPEVDPKLNDKQQVESVTITKTLTIQTIYGANVTSSSLSGYGRGFIDADTNKTLGYHEGWHGTDFLNYIQSHDFPDIKITKPISKGKYNKLLNKFNSAVRKYKKAMYKDSEKRTDKVKNPKKKKARH